MADHALQSEPDGRGLTAAIGERCHVPPKADTETDRYARRDALKRPGRCDPSK